eukprot:6562607-Prymnesium_polylepis.1
MPRERPRPAVRGAAGRRRGAVCATHARAAASPDVGLALAARPERWGGNASRAPFAFRDEMASQPSRDTGNDACRRPRVCGVCASSTACGCLVGLVSTRERELHGG